LASEILGLGGTLPGGGNGTRAPGRSGRELALENPDAFFLSQSGECFHNVTVTGGKQRAEGPLSMKRELRELLRMLEELERALRDGEARPQRLETLLVEGDGFEIGRSTLRCLGRLSARWRSLVVRPQDSGGRVWWYFCRSGSRPPLLGHKRRADLEYRAGSGA
jgi:hypothetical protein